MNETNCPICMDNKLSSYKCKTCNNSICIECYKKISLDFFDRENKKMVLYYKCPFCITTNKNSYFDFNRDDLENVANSHIEDYHQIYADTRDEFVNKKVKEYKKIISNLNDKNNKQSTEIDRLNLLLKQKEQDYNNKIIFLNNCINNQVNNLKFLCEKDKTKTLKKCILKPFYERKIEIIM